MAAASSRSWKYDVFLSFRGEDTRKTYVDHLYKALSDQLIHTYKDDETLPRGDSIGPSLLEAISGSQIAVIIFSENYADSSWCLDELSYIIKCRDDKGQIVIPVFYNVNPSEVRKQEGEFGKAFAKQKQKNIMKAESWRKALFDASNIAGWEPKHIANGHESSGIKKIVDAILDKLFQLNYDVNEYLVGMGTRLESLSSLLEIGSGGVHMVGIWGVGGSGKTTLAYSAYKKISHKFEGHCFIDNIREESTKLGLKKLQEKVLSTLLKTKVKVQNIEEGKNMIRSRLSHSNVLIVLDDVDDDSQIEALAESRSWFGHGSRIIITTRDEHLLKKDSVKISLASLLSRDEAIQLLYRYAVKEDKPIDDYDTLSQRVVSYADGLPLAIKVLGSFLHGKDKNEWLSALAKLKDIPNLKIVDKLKISYDGLEPYEKDLFLDIACFFRRQHVKKAVKMLDACGFHSGIGIKVLRQKALITISNGKFDMHDLVQEMGHHIVRGKHPHNPEKHNRVWHHEEIKNMCCTDVTMENDKVEAIQYHGCVSGFSKLVSNMKKLRFLYYHWLHFCYDQDVEGPSFLSNELRCIVYTNYPGSRFPANFQATKLVVLKLTNTLQKELWQGYKRLPHLKELYLKEAKNLLSTPDFDGLPCLEKLSLKYCHNLEEIHPSLGNHRSIANVCVAGCKKLRTFPTIVSMKKLEILRIRSYELLEFPEIQASMDSLVELSWSSVGIEVLPSSIVRYCTNLNSLMVENSKYIEGNFQALKQLQSLRFRYINSSLKNLSFPHVLMKLDLYGCGLEDGAIPCDVGELFNLTELNLGGNNFSRLPFSLMQLNRLKVLKADRCRKLHELPELPSSLAILTADFCTSLESIGGFYTNCNWLCQVSISSFGKNVTGGERLLQSMLQGKAIENHSMELKVESLEIAKTFRPRLRRGNTCRLQLPQNWCNDFRGFLMCAALTHGIRWTPNICMKHQQGGTIPGCWTQCDDDKAIWVGYVSFGSLRHTTWWDPTYNAVSFSVCNSISDIRSRCRGFGVRLISRENGSGLTETSDDSSDFREENDDYMLKFNILEDTKAALDIVMESPYV